METDLAAWEQGKRQLQIGQRVACIVHRHYPFGMLASLEHPPLMGVIELILMGKDGLISPAGYPPVGSRIAAEVIGFRDYNHEVELRLLPGDCAGGDPGQR